MIKKGMEVGAVFEDGGSHYVVTALSGENYISRRLTNEEVENLESKSGKVEPEKEETVDSPKKAEPAARKDPTRKATVQKRGR